MPLTLFQKEVLAVLAGNRSEASHFAGGLVLNASDASARYSHDFDVFHEAVADLVAASEKDVSALEEHGFQVEKIEHSGEWSRPSSFRKARVHGGDARLELDWAHDSAFRFFPIVPDELLGWRLHLFDMATNKALALSARMETRDYMDMVELSRRYRLEAIVWAACGKDPGVNPLSLLKMMLRFARINPMELDKIKARQLDPLTLKVAAESSGCRSRPFHHKAERRHWSELHERQSMRHATVWQSNGEQMRSRVRVLDKTGGKCHDGRSE